MNKLLFIPFISITLLARSCPFSFGDGGAWKEKFGTPELLLENAVDEANVYLYEKDNQYKDKDNVIKKALQEVTFESSDSKSVPKDIQYFTYEAEWIPATSGPNYEHLSIWNNGFVRIDHKTSLGPHEYLYFSIDEAKALELVNFVFSLIQSEE